jgi:hypothetical protein
MIMTLLLIILILTGVVSTLPLEITKMISRGFTWIDDSIEHSDADYARAAALAKKWSFLETEREDKCFRRLADQDSGYDYDPFQDCECEFCLGEGDSSLTECTERAAFNKQQEEAQAERDLELELVNDKLAAIGARMMRPYEHWNEDERYMEYMENRSDY